MPVAVRSLVKCALQVEGKLRWDWRSSLNSTTVHKDLETVIKRVPGTSNRMKSSTRSSYFGLIRSEGRSPTLALQEPASHRSTSRGRPLRASSSAMPLSCTSLQHRAREYWSGIGCAHTLRDAAIFLADLAASQVLTGMFGITLSYHRQLAHLSFKSPKAT